VRTLMTVLMLSALVCCIAVAQEGPTVQLAQPFDAPYTGEDATGDQVVALWQFDGGAELADVSGHGHDLTLNGGEVVPEGRFGGALRSGAGWPLVDDPHQAVAQPSPDFTPKGAFTVEMWIQAAPELSSDYPVAFLLDNRYVDKTGIQFTLGSESGSGRALGMEMGFGADTAIWRSKPLVYEPGVWHHIAFTYDGAGTGRFFVDGTSQGGATSPERGSVAPGVKRLMIGDRVGSLYHGFPGLIDQVRICQGALEFRPGGFEVTSVRRVFQRMEPDAAISFSVVNYQREAMSGANVGFMLGTVRMPVQLVPDLGPGESYPIDLPLDTSLRPDEYRLAATMDIPGERPYHSTEEFGVTITPRPPEMRMPVVMWGGALNQIDQLKELGFTHCVGVSADFKKIWEAGETTDPGTPESVATTIQNLDKALANGIGLVAGLSPGRSLRGNEELRRVGRDGKPVGEDVCGLFPQVPQFCYNVGASVARAYGDHPALQAGLIHTEVRGESRPCFHEHDQAAFRQFAGYDIPEGVAAQRAANWDTIADFPADRVIANDYPLYVYLKWYWKVGDGWNAMHTAVAEGLKSTGSHLWTFHDPAVRCASVYGSGGDVDYLGHWTYSYPDPIRIGLCTDELFCMAGGAERGDQQVMKMTQIIWYRSQTAPEPGEQAAAQTADFADQDVRPAGTGSVDASGRYQAAWEREIPGARFITIAPMHLREALWTKLSRPIQGIMYHGWGSLVPLQDNTGAYQYTNPETRWELRRLVETVIRPLGPALMQVPDRPSDVAFLESFASQMFARRGTWGWNGGWAGDAYLILEYAGLQPRVIYDETVDEQGLGDFKVLVMVDCDVLTRAVADAAKAFQDAGGIIIGDENLCPAIQPDILLPSHVRPSEADEGRRLNLEAAANLRADLDAHYQRYAQSSTPDVITRVRAYGSTDYLFALNDLREFGDYVGHHKRVMENGLPTDADLQLNRAAGYVYDLLAHREVQPQRAGGSLTIARSFGPCEGCVYMITEREIAGVRVEVPESAAPGGEVAIKVAVTDAAGAPIDAVVPVRVDILDPSGRAAELSGWYGARDGQVEVRPFIAINDMPGLWRIHVEDLASGATADAYMRVTAG